MLSRFFNSFVQDAVDELFTQKTPLKPDYLAQNIHQPIPQKHSVAASPLKQEMSNAANYTVAGSWPIEEHLGTTLPAALTLYVPFRKYTLILRHQILSSLGKVSQFVLQALATDGFGVDDILRITGLSQEHLSPILDRLAGLGWYEPASRALTSQGGIMAQVATLTGQRFSLWIDGYDNSSISQILLSSERLLSPETVATEIKLTEFERDWNILDVLQRQRLVRRLGGGKNSQGELLPLLKLLCDTSHHNALEHQRTAWDFRLEIDRDVRQCQYLAVTLPQGLYLGGGKGKSLPLYAPQLSCRIIYSLPSWLATDISRPDPVSISFCQITGQSIDETVRDDQASSWPLASMLPRAELLAKIRASVPSADPLLSQEVSLISATRKLSLNYSVLAKVLAENIPVLTGDNQ